MGTQVLRMVNISGLGEPKKPKAQLGFFRGKQTSLTRRIMWHGSTAFLLGGFIWATYATIQNESKWKTQLYFVIASNIPYSSYQIINREHAKFKDYEVLVKQYKDEFENNPNDTNTNGAH